ncbi:hypothetical protein JRO89_XS04G0183800 [Xanthoceras sorbifolium]|uniref:Major facilitator superfamily (MFS) profile domain-containing protein n=1 Tax=Xanthoceras sorbifolium TaxID=99658 RepID=A0ABQ8I626_9ROSI|nr:hypothetical protein JRO89_XS04G0183800 [Xanthoceras sorbifolium]
MDEEGRLPLISSSFSLKSGESIKYGSGEGLLISDFEDPSSSSSPITFKVVFSSLVAVCGSYIYGHAVGYSSPAESGIMEDLGLTTKQYTVFSSILTVGAMLGAVLSGRVADFVGRRAAMGISGLLCILGWLAITLAEDATWLDLGRFVVGCGIGLVSYAVVAANCPVPIYVAEITPRNVRGTFTALNPLLMGFGQSFAFLYGPLLNWRILALIGIIPGVIQLPCLFFIPESPRWLAKVGRMKDFEASLQSLRGENYDISQEANEIKDKEVDDEMDFIKHIIQQEYTNYLREISGDGFLSLFQRKYALSLVVGVGLIVFQRFGGVYGFLFYASTIFESAGFSSRIGTIAAGVVQIITTTLGLLLIDRCGRRPMLLVSIVGACFGCLITAMAFVFKDLKFGTEVTGVLVLIGVVIFPINIKGPAGSLVILVSWIGSWVVAYTFDSLFEWSSADDLVINRAISFSGVDNILLTPLHIMEEELAVTIRPLLVINDELDNDDDQQCNVTFMLVLSTLVAVCGSYVFGNALGYSSSAETGIVDDFNLTTAEYSVFASILTIGAMLGAILSGKIADLIGRRGVSVSVPIHIHIKAPGAMGVADIFCCIGWLAIVLSKLMIGVGKALFFLIGSLVNWRALAIIETPRWLVKIGRFEEFEDSLQRLRGKNADISREATDIKDYTDYLERISAKDGFLSLFQQKYSRSIIIVVGLMIFKELGGIDGFTFYASNLFKSADYNVRSWSTLCRPFRKATASSSKYGN